MRKKRFYPALLLLLLTFAKLYSDDSLEDLFDTAALFDSAEEKESPLVFSGEHEFFYTLPYVDTKRFESPDFYNTFTLNYTSDNIEIVSTWEFAIPENSLTPDENYIEMTFADTIIRTGYTLFSWGYADGSNPTDKLNSKDFSDPLDISSIPSLALSAEQFIGTCSVEAVYIPVRQGAIFSNLLISNIPATLVASDTIEYSKINKVDQYVLGGRLNFYGKADLSLSYIYNYDDYYIPEITMNPGYPGSGLPLSGLTLKNQRIHQMGLSSKTIINRLGLWLEANYSLPGVSKDYLEWVAGFDFAFGPEDQGLFNMQTTGKWRTDFLNITEENEITETLTGSLQNLSSEVTLGLIGKTSYSLFNEELKAECLCVYMTTGEDEGVLILKPALTCKPIDSLAIEAGMNTVNVLGESDFYESVHKNDAIFLSVKYNW